MAEPTSCPRVLVVEDDPDQRELICDALGVHYGPAADGRIAGAGTAAEVAARDLTSFDVVLLDYHLPDMEGLAVLREVLAGADVPVIFVTGENDSAIAAEAIRCGAQDYVVKLGDYLFALPVVIEKSIRQHEVGKENQALQQQLQLTLDELKVKNTQLEQSLERLRTLVATDDLTGLANRRRFREVLDRQFGEAVRYGFDLSCCMCDLDRYKEMNDTLGHQFGDRILVITADVIRSTLRQSDTAARYGGDEFVLLLPHTDSARARAVGGRLREQLVLEVRKFDNLAQSQTLSVGIASLHADRPTSADVLVSMADRALYVAKARGKDQIVMFREVASSVWAA